MTPTINPPHTITITREMLKDLAFVLKKVEWHGAILDKHAPICPCCRGGKFKDAWYHHSNRCKLYNLLKKLRNMGIEP